MFCEKCGSQMIKVGKVHNCTKCDYIRFDNALSVAIVLIPVYNDQYQLKLVGVRRGELPKIGELALPGGFQEIEQASEAGAREVEEETGMNVIIDDNHEVLILTTPDGRRNLIFFVAKAEAITAVDFNFKTKETLEVVLIDENTPLAFPLHEKAVKWFYNKHSKTNS